MRYMTLLCVLALGVVGCADKDSDEKNSDGKDSGSNKTEKPTGPVFKTKMRGVEMVQSLVEKDLGEMGLAGLTIQAPEKAKVKKKSPKGHKLVAAGVNYSLTIKEGPLAKDTVKEAMKFMGDDVKLVVDEPEQIIFSKGGSHFFHAETKVDGKSYECSNVATAASFSRSEVDQMIKSCRSLAKK